MRVAVIGTGIMGAGIAGSLAREGHEVVVWNRTAARAEAVAGDGVTAAGSVAEALLAGGRRPDTPVAVVCDGSMPGERTVFSTLAALTSDLEREAVKPPAIIVVGDVVAVAQGSRG